jgi:hypothetical protein
MTKTLMNLLRQSHVRAVFSVPNSKHLMRVVIECPECGKDQSMIVSEKGAKEYFDSSPHSGMCEDCSGGERL